MINRPIITRILSFILRTISRISSASRYASPYRLARWNSHLSWHFKYTGTPLSSARLMSKLQSCFHSASSSRSKTQCAVETLRSKTHDCVGASDIVDTFSVPIFYRNAVDTPSKWTSWIWDGNSSTFWKVALAKSLKSHRTLEIK